MKKRPIIIRFPYHLSTEEFRAILSKRFSKYVRKLPIQFQPWAIASFCDQSMVKAVRMRDVSHFLRVPVSQLHCYDPEFYVNNILKIKEIYFDAGSFAGKNHRKKKFFASIDYDLDHQNPKLIMLFVNDVFENILGFKKFMKLSKVGYLDNFSLAPSSTQTGGESIGEAPLQGQDPI